MCEVLLWLTDPPGVDEKHPLRSQNYSAGDVIEVREDDARWTEAELKCPSWQVVRLPGVPVTSLADLMMAKFDALGNFLSKREQGIRIGEIKSILQKYDPVQVAVLSDADRVVFLDAKVVKTGALVIG